jgi:hypothetical protein
MLTLESLKSVISYDAETGAFTWIANLGKRGLKGRVAGSKENHKNGNAYLRISVFRKRYFAHRLAWFYTYGEWPVLEIDHIDGDGLNNRMSTLRVANKIQQAQNRGIHRSNRSGLKGISWKKARKRWQAQIEFDGKAKYLGSFSDKHQAAEAYAEAAKKYHGEFARV